MRAPTPDGWNHNTHYHELLLQSVPRPCSRALDVGCGLGTFARRLSARCDHVDAVDADAAVVDRARSLSTHARNVRFIEANFMTWSADQTYDVVSMIAVLHHLAFADALAKAAGLLRPGGVLLVLGLDRASSPADFVTRGLIGYPVSLYHRAIRRTSKVGAPIREPSMTLAEIRHDAGARLPGAVIRRQVLWRYSLMWRK